MTEEHTRKRRHFSEDSSNRQGKPEIINNQASRKFRPEIQGLRALAVLLVAAYHFWFGKVSGGVDVFLLISAFLMAGSFTRKIENHKFKGVSTVTSYWVHVFKRILPLATVSILLILAGTYLVLPEERWPSIISEAKSVVFYYENWWSIHNMVDYYASDSSQASPLRHFWSLSLQGQIYIIWPLIFLFSAGIIKFLGLHVRRTLFIIFGLVFGFSLTYSIYITAAAQQTAYFNTFARLWEFALGSLVAIILPGLNINRYIRAIMGWVGIAMIVSCGFIFDVEGVFPGYHALWPTLAASAIIIAGDTQTKFGPEKLLTLRPLMNLGGFSYGLYLIHWPLLVFYLYRNHAEKAGYVSGIGLLVISMVIAYIITRFIEQPLRSLKSLDYSPWRASIVVITCMALVLGTTVGWQKNIDDRAAQLEALKAANNPGARSLEPGFVYQGADNPTYLPVGEKRASDFYDLNERCADTNPEYSLPGVSAEHCYKVVANSNPTKRVIAVGNSHVHMWAAALAETAKRENWDLTIVTRGWCHFGNPGLAAADLDCAGSDTDWTEFIQSQHPDAVFMIGTVITDTEAERTDDLTMNKVREFTDQGISVVGLRDTPRADGNPLVCLQDGNSQEDCTFDADQDVNANPLTQYQDSIPGFGAMNMSDQICPDGLCKPAIGNIWTWFDHIHVTSTYIETTSDVFQKRFDEALATAEASKST